MGLSLKIVLKFTLQIRPDRFGATFGLEDMSMVVDGKSVLRPGQANNTTEPDFGHFAFPSQRGYVTPKKKAGVPLPATPADSRLYRSQSSGDQSTSWGDGWDGNILK